MTKKLWVVLALVTAVLAGGYYYLAHKPIHKAAREGSLFSIKRYLSRGGDIEQFSPRAFISGFTMEETPLHHAVIGNQPEAVTLLLERGANPDAQNIFKMTPLHYAVAYHNLKIIAILLEKGANPNLAGQYGRSPLQLILQENYPNYLREQLLSRTVPDQLQVLELLLSRGANLEFKDKFGATAFLLASSLQSIEILQYLLEKGANPFALDIAGANALYYLLTSSGRAQNRHENQYEIFQFLVRQGLDIRHKNAKQQILLHFACNDRIAGFLIDQGLDVNAIGDQLTTPLHKLLVSLHCLKPRKAIFRLLEAGADPNIVDNKKVSPLHRVLIGTLHLELLPLLLEKGADVGVKSFKYGDTPLHLAARNKYDTKPIEQLLARGANINQQNNEGCTPLHKAIYVNPPAENLAVLVKNGADVNIAEKNGVAPLHLLAGNTNSFERWGQQLLEHSADITLRDNTGRTPLDWAIEAQNQPAIDALKALNAPRGTITRPEKIQMKGS